MLFSKDAGHVEDSTQGRSNTTPFIYRRLMLGRFQQGGEDLEEQLCVLLVIFRLMRRLDGGAGCGGVCVRVGGVETAAHSWLCMAYLRGTCVVAGRRSLKPGILG